MKNISFDNPYFLFIAIPLLAFIVIPFAISIRKDNKSKSVITSLILHILIVGLVTLGIAGTVITQVKTETEVIVVADVSYSANRNLNTLDRYIMDVQKGLPDNSKMGVVCFGADQVIQTEIGAEFTTVQNSGVNDSATDIASALKFASGQFSENVIKRIVLITDGKQTDNNASAQLIGTIDGLKSEGIYIDAVYLDDNIDENTHEVQISGVDYVQSTFINHETVADILIQSNKPTTGKLTVFRKTADTDYTQYGVFSLDLDRGYNVINLSLPTSESGDFDYKLSVDAYGNDTSPNNNEYLFTQTVSSELEVLLLSSSKEKIETAQALYGDKANIKACRLNENMTDRQLIAEGVPFKLEDICKYDEIMLYDVDVRLVPNYTAFIDSVEKAVSIFGKSLVTVGDTKIQNKTDETLKALEDMLPVKYGNGDQEKKYVALVIDASRSMETLEHLTMAKQAAIQLLNLLHEGDQVMVVSFAGDVIVERTQIDAKNKSEVAATISDIQPRQGTVIGLGLQRVCELMKGSSIENKQVFLISDGRSWDGAADNPVTAAKELYANGIIVSSLHTSKPDLAEDTGTYTMQEVAANGGGNYYNAATVDQVGDKILSEIADKITETVVIKDTKVNIVKKNDKVLGGMVSLPNIGGYIYGKTKSSATKVLVAEYEKNAETKIEVPIYSYWEYGNGKVATLTTDLFTAGGKAEAWSEGDGYTFLKNILTTNVPEEKINYPFTFSLEYDGQSSTVEIIPVSINPAATVSVEITMPDGETQTKELIFDSEKYFHSFDTPTLGKHKVKVVYTVDGTAYEAHKFINLSYSPEYDSFTSFDISSLYEAIRNRGSVNEDGNIVLENDQREVSTYTVDLTIPFLAAAIVLYIVDIIIRKLKWEDIKSLFKKTGPRKEANVQ